MRKPSAKKRGPTLKERVLKALKAAPRQRLPFDDLVRAVYPDSGNWSTRSGSVQRACREMGLMEYKSPGTIPGSFTRYILYRKGARP